MGLPRIVSPRNNFPMLDQDNAGYWWQWSRAELGKVIRKMTVECASVHTTRPWQVLSHAHMCANGKCHIQRKTQLGPTKLRKMCVRQRCTVYNLWCFF